MPLGMTFLDMQSQTRVYIDDRSMDRFTTNTEIKNALNRSQEQIQHLIDEADENFFIACQPYNVTPTTDSLEFVLPDDFQKVIQVERVVTGGPPIKAMYREFRARHEEGYYSDPYVRSFSTDVPVYYLKGTKLGVVAPNDTYTLWMWYQQKVADLVNDTDYSAISPDFRNLICLKAAGILLGSEGLEMKQELRDEYAEELEQLRRHVDRRQLQTSRTVHYIEP